MNRFTLFLFMIFLFVPLAEARELEVTRKVGDYKVDIVIDHNPPLAIGKNQIGIAIEDNGGNKVTDAKVLVNYFMPPMPRMAPMNYRTEAEFRKGKYHATMKFIMAGPWHIAILIERGGKTTSVRINVDAQ